MSTDKGASWTQISGDLTTNDSVKIDQSNNGGLSVDITGAENYCTIISIEPSAKERGVIWVGTDDGNIQLTRDGGKTWTNFRGKLPGMPAGAWVPQIRASKHNAGEAYVVVNDYRRGNNKPYLYRTTDYGKTWTNLVDEKKVTGYTLCVIQDPTEPNLIFVGTEQGLFISFDYGTNFQQFKNGYPSVSTYDMVIQEREADLVIATFGRAIYILDDINPLRKLAANKGQLFSNKLTAFAAPQAYQAKRKLASGIEYSIWGSYEGENKRGGAPISFFVNKTASDTGKNRISDTVTLRIYDAKNELVRTLRTKVDTGFNKYYWGMEGKGVRTGGGAGGRGGGGGGRGGAGGGFGGFNAEPPGLPVDPGTYKVVLSLGRNLSDSTMVVVNDDPYAPTPKEVRDAIRKANDRLNNSAIRLGSLNDRMVDAETIMNKIETALPNLDAKKADTIRKSIKAVKDGLTNIRTMLNGKPQTRQGYGNIPQVTVNTYLSEARSNVMGKSTMPGEQEERLMKAAEDKISEVITIANQLFDTKWKTLRSVADTIELKLFKDYKTLE
ncbi:MAG: WD40/YVTN/BNR-like repeat-containing protein [Sediminibacterium sp.]